MGTIVLCDVKQVKHSNTRYLPGASLLWKDLITSRYHSRYCNYLQHTYTCSFMPFIDISTYKQWAMGYYMNICCHLRSLFWVEYSSMHCSYDVGMVYAGSCVSTTSRAGTKCLPGCFASLSFVVVSVQ